MPRTATTIMAAERSKTSAHATLHCLTGCVIGEVAGLMIGITLGLGAWPTMILATALSYLFGHDTLASCPSCESRMSDSSQALKIIWIGEVISLSA